MSPRKTPAKRKEKRTRRRPIGYVMFRVDGGVVNDTEVDLIRGTKSAQHLAELLVEEQRRDDRYANPDHPHYDPEYAESTAEEYEKRLDDARRLRNVSLNEDDDLVILQVFDYFDAPARKKPPRSR